MYKLVLGFAALLAGAPLVLHAPEKPEPLRGLWSRFEAKREGDPMRFYYFHDGGIGLYRYGRLGLNNTNSFDYAVRGGRLELRFRKTGERWDVPFRIEADPKDRDREWLVLEKDPREQQPTRYFRKKSAAAEQKDFNRMWTCEQRYATGGMGFRIYQLREPAADGRGMGWYHQGDYDDWSTESLLYRITGAQLHLSFVLRKEAAATTFRVEQGRSARTLELREDPRNFWHVGRFEDRGRSFGLLQDVPL